MKNFSAFLRSVPSGAVIRFSFVITSLTFLFLSSSKRRSRLVRMPTSLLFLSTIGIPPILFSFISLNASPMVASASKCNRINDQSAFTSLYFSHLFCLFFNGHVFMQNANAAFSGKAIARLLQ